MTDKCTECEKEIMLKYAALAYDYDAALNRIRLLEEGLRVTRKLCDMYSERCKELEIKATIYTNILILLFCQPILILLIKKGFI